MKERLPIADCRLPIAAQPGRAVSPLTAVGAHGVTRPTHSIVNRKSKIVNGFTLVEVMVVVVLMSFIVLALMAVFNSTQAAFRNSVTQAGVMEDGRATMDLMAADLRAMTPSYGSNSNFVGAVNFYAVVYSAPPLIQPMVGGSSQRTNSLEIFFMLSRQNQTWTGVGYAVNASSSSPLYPLYRFSMSTNAASDPLALYSSFNNAVSAGLTNMSHLMDGVVSLTVHAYDINGYQMIGTNQFDGSQWVTNKNMWFSQPINGQVGFVMFSNTLPASVEIEMGVLEDRALQRTESLGISGQAPSSVTPQWGYLTNSASQVHVFRQRVSIPNVDSSAYR